MSLQDELDEVTQNLSIHLPPETLKNYLESKQRIVEAGSARNALKIGDQAPDFVLPDIHGQPVSLSESLGRGPVIVNFYRGGWCDYCNLELRALQDALERHAESVLNIGASLLAISPQTLEHSADTAANNHLSFHLLSDEGNKVARAYGLVYALDEKTQGLYSQAGILLPDFNGDDSWELPHPATYVLAKDGRICWAYANEDYFKRAEPEEVFSVLDELSGS